MIRVRQALPTVQALVAAAPIKMFDLILSGIVFVAYLGGMVWATTQATKNLNDDNERGESK